LSGLADAADASFTLSTAVPAGVETANALTGTHTVCDAAGNCVTAGPIAGNKIDRKGPSINITTPAQSAVYVLNATVPAGYACDDGGSGVATCQGPVADGGPVDTSSAGTHSFQVSATDAVGNTSNASVSYVVTYNVCLDYDPSKQYPAGAAIAIRLHLCDVNN